MVRLASAWALLAGGPVRTGRPGREQEAAWKTAVEMSSQCGSGIETHLPQGVGEREKGKGSLASGGRGAGQDSPKPVISLAKKMLLSLWGPEGRKGRLGDLPPRTLA